MHASVAFYTSIGFEIVKESDTYTTLRLGDSQLALNVPNSSERQPGQQSVVLKSNDIPADHVRIKSVCNTVSAIEDTGFGPTFIFLDLDGNKLEVV